MVVLVDFNDALVTLDRMPIKMIEMMTPSGGELHDGRLEILDVEKSPKYVFIRSNSYEKIAFAWIRPNEAVDLRIHLSRGIGCPGIGCPGIGYPGIGATAHRNEGR